MRAAVRQIVQYRRSRPSRLALYLHRQVPPEQANVVQLSGPRAMLLDPEVQELLRGCDVTYHFTDGGLAPDLEGIYRDRVRPGGSFTPPQTQTVLDDATATLQRWGLGNREKARLVFATIKHEMSEMEENTRSAQLRRPLPEDDRTSLDLVIDGYECPADMRNRKNVLETLARGVRRTRQQVAKTLNVRNFATPAGGTGTDTQKFARLYWALHTVLGVSDED